MTGEPHNFVFASPIHPRAIFAQLDLAVVLVQKLGIIEFHTEGSGFEDTAL